MDPRFNALWLEYRIAFFSFLSQLPAMRPLCIATALRNSFFLHFAVLAEEMAAYDPRVIADFRDFQMPSDCIRQIEEGWRMLAASRGNIQL